MPSDHFPTQVLYLQLPQERRQNGHLRLHYKGTIKRNLTKMYIYEGSLCRMRPTTMMMIMMMYFLCLRTAQPTSGGTVTADTNCCVNCVETYRPQQWRPDLPFWGKRPCGPTGWLALLLIKAGHQHYSNIYTADTGSGHGLRR